jgi:predicted TIM-barrel fold metal-dependent hydrolase
MDEAGITVEVLSASGPGADLLDGQAGIDFAYETNDRLAKAIAKHPTRLAGFAHLPLRSPEAAADELERAVRELGFKGALINGTTQDRFLDHPSFDALLARAVALDVPLYLHPGIPPASVRKAYYDSFSPPISPALQMILSGPGWGWHADTAVHVLRLVLSGALDRHRGLRLIIGHLGEMIPMMMARFDDVFVPEVTRLERSVSQTILDHVVITTSGFFSTAPFVAALMTFGVDRILFSVDYPYAQNERGRAFLDRLPVPAEELNKIAHANADRILKLRT